MIRDSSVSLVSRIWMVDDNANWRTYFFLLNLVYVDPETDPATLST